MRERNSANIVFPGGASWTSGSRKKNYKKGN